jgi:hypothetical protein
VFARAQLITTKAAMNSLEDDAARVESLARLSRFRREFRACLAGRGDELFELTDAVLCADGPVATLVGLSLAPEHRRGHGALYDGLCCGRVGIGRLRWALACLPPPRWPDGRILLAADVSPWLRPDAATSPGRLFCHVHGRARGQAQMIPGWPYSVVAALEPGRTSWTAVLDAVRLGPADDQTEVTAAQVRDVVNRIIEAGHWHDGDPDIVIVFDVGYDVTRLAWLLRDLPVELAGFPITVVDVVISCCPSREREVRCGCSGCSCRARRRSHGPCSAMTRCHWSRWSGSWVTWPRSRSRRTRSRPMPTI